MREFRLAKMTWPEIKRALTSIDAVILPVGSTEQHGRHLPLDFDSYTSIRIAALAAERLNHQKLRVLVAPGVCYGCSWYHMQFPGTMTLSQDTFMRVVKELCESLHHHGFKNIVILNSHGGNMPALTTCLNDLYAVSGIRAVIAPWSSLAAETVKELGITTPRLHASEAETSLALALNARVLEKELSAGGMDRRSIHRHNGIPNSRHIAYDPSVPGSGVIIPMDHIKDISESGVVGDATKADLENGKKILASIINKLIELIEDLSQ